MGARSGHQRQPGPQHYAGTKSASYTPTGACPWSHSDPDAARDRANATSDDDATPGDAAHARPDTDAVNGSFFLRYNGQWLHNDA